MNHLALTGLLLAGMLSLSPSTAQAGWYVDPAIAKPAVGFNANGSPGALDIEATTNDGTLTDDGVNLLFTVPLANVKTGIDLRDEHMKTKFMHVDQHPNVTLSIAHASLMLPTELGKKTSGKNTAQFTALGVAKPTDLTWEVQKTVAGYKLTGSFAFDISEHGVEVPSFMGVTVDSKMTARAVFYVVAKP